MRIEVRLDPDRLVRWQVHVVEALSADPAHAVSVSAGQAADWPIGVAALFRLERTLYRAPTDDPLAPADWSAFEPAKLSEMPDLRLDLAGDSEPDPTPTLRILADGQPLELGSLAAVLDGRVPAVDIVLINVAEHRVLRRAWPATEAPQIAHVALGMILSRAADLAVQAVEGFHRFRLTQPVAAPADVEETMRLPPLFFLAALGRKIDGRLKRLLGRAPNWFVALRQRHEAGLPDLSQTGFTRLPDDGGRFFADPFIREQDGQRYLFVEEYPFATGKGIISVATIRPDGVPGPLRPVLETGCHLSYPFLFDHDDAIWMIPETSARRTVELYRADPFPERWILHSVLIDGQDLADVTLQQIDGTWWMFAASRARWTSSWDALSLFSAPTPFGPWAAHPDNPVLVDVRSARPAGNLLTAGGHLVRPVQDSAAGYGAALGFAVIDRLSPEAYRQTVTSQAAPWPPHRGLHTYNRSASIEVIDLFGPRR